MLRNKWIWFWGIVLIANLICLLILVFYLLINYQSSEVVIRTTHFDGRVEVSGGRVPWRRPDFEAGGKKGIEVIRKDGTRLRIRKVEMWFRKADNRKHLIEAFRRLETFSERQ